MVFATLAGRDSFAAGPGAFPKLSNGGWGPELHKCLTLVDPAQGF